MTDSGHRYHVGFTSVLRRCGLALFCLAPLAAYADAWDEFVARCLDPFEHLTLEVVSDLKPQPVDQMHEARRAYGPTEDGYIVVLDASPSLGERACLVEAPGQEDSPGARDWMQDQLASGRYMTGEDGWLVSHEWIEPRLMVRARTSDVQTTYTVVETNFES